MLNLSTWQSFNAGNAPVGRVPQKAPTLQRENLLESGQTRQSAPRANLFLAEAPPRQVYTRINGQNIPRPNFSWYLPPFSQEHCTAHLSHEEWMNTLDDEVRRRLDSHGNAEHLSYLNSECRFHMVALVELEIELGIQEYHEKVFNAFIEMAESMGLLFAGLSESTYPIRYDMAHFKCPDGDEGKMVVVLADGRKIFADVPPDFSQEGFRMLDKRIQQLMLEMDLLRSDVLESRLQRFFEELFDEIFPSESTTQPRM